MPDQAPEAEARAFAVSFRSFLDWIHQGDRESGERNPVAALKAVVSMPRFNMIKQMSESKAVIGLNMLSLWKDRGTLQPWIAPLREMLDDGTIKPVVAGSFSFEDAGAAQSMITERRNVGKVVLTP